MRRRGAFGAFEWLLLIGGLVALALVVACGLTLSYRPPADLSASAETEAFQLAQPYLEALVERPAEYASMQALYLRPDGCGAAPRMPGAWLCAAWFSLPWEHGEPAHHYAAVVRRDGQVWQLLWLSIDGEPVDLPAQ